MTKKIAEMNRILMQKMSVFLNYEPTFVQKSMVDELCRDCGLREKEAFSHILAAVISLDTEHDTIEREIFTSYFPRMLHHLKAEEFAENPYLCEISFSSKVSGAWELLPMNYRACEAFACDDLREFPDGAVIPQIGFFTEDFFYPAVRERGRIWMTVTPNEIRTMQKPIARAHGSVLTYGLGLGYFAFMAARKPKVDSVTVVERDQNAIALFEEVLRPQMSCAHKIKVVQADAFDYAAHTMHKEGFDFVFADIWHDASDGVDAYLRLKATEALSPHTEFMYWIEDTLRFYL